MERNTTRTEEADKAELLAVAKDYPYIRRAAFALSYLWGLFIASTAVWCPRSAAANFSLLTSPIP